jgi:hypothetical protein
MPRYLLLLQVVVAHPQRYHRPVLLDRSTPSRQPCQARRSNLRRLLLQRVDSQVTAIARVERTLWVGRPSIRSGRRAPLQPIAGSVQGCTGRCATHTVRAPARCVKPSGRTEQRASAGNREQTPQTRAATEDAHEVLTGDSFGTFLRSFPRFLAYDLVSLRQ